MLRNLVRCPLEDAEAAETVAVAQAAETLSPEVKRDLAIRLNDTDDVAPECVGGVAGVGVSVGVQVGGVVKQRPAGGVLGEQDAGSSVCGEVKCVLSQA